MVLRLLKGGHDCVVYDEDPASREKLAASGAVAVDSLAAMVAALQRPRPIWMMIPDKVVDSVIAKLADLLDPVALLGRLKRRHEVDGGRVHELPHRQRTVT